MIYRHAAVFLSLIFILSGCGKEYYEDRETGIGIRELGSDLNNRWALKGVIVESVRPGSPADKLIHAGELISYIVDERHVSDKKEFRKDLSAALEKDKKAILRISKVISASSPEELGIQVKSDPEERGVIVSWMKPGSKAEKAGIKLETVIYQVSGKTVKSVDEYNQLATDEMRSSGKVTFNMGREVMASKISKVGIGDVEAAEGGVVVTKMEKIELEGSPASMEGIKEGDVITHVVDEMRITDIDSYKKAVKKAADADRVVFKRGEIGGIKLTIIDALGEIGDARAVEPLLKALESKDRWIRRSAAAALVKMKDERIIQPLLWHLLEKNEPDPEVRRSAAEALARTRPEGAIEPLAQALRDSSLGVRLKAGYALGRIGEPAIEVLIQARKDPDSKVRDIAVATLGDVGGKQVKSELIGILRDEKEEPTVKLTAIQALGKIGDAESIAELRKVATSGDPKLSAFVKELLAEGNSSQTQKM